MIRLHDWVAYSVFYASAFDYMYAKGLSDLFQKIRGHHPLTFYHMLRVGFLAGFLAYTAESAEIEIVNTIVAGSLHDLGKLQTPVSILEKPGRLTDTEFQEIRRHPAEGVSILKNFKLESPVLEGIYQHHERVDGSGYYGITKISPMASRISVADTYDALMEDRSYRSKFNESKTMEILKDAQGEDSPEIGQLNSIRVLDMLWQNILLNKN